MERGARGDVGTGGENGMVGDGIGETGVSYNQVCKLLGILGHGEPFAIAFHVSRMCFSV